MTGTHVCLQSQSSVNTSCRCGAGEYPMTGTQAAEKEAPGSRADKLHRGRNVVLAFTMQVRSVLSILND